MLRAPFRNEHSIHTIPNGFAHATFGDGNNECSAGIRLERCQAEWLEPRRIHHDGRPVEQRDDVLVGKPPPMQETRHPSNFARALNFW
jgi:hypothetical protein